MEIAEMTIKDYAAVFTLWQASSGVGLHDDVDSKEGIAKYIARNKGLSFTAHEKGRLVGAVLCGHDGRRGYLHHLAVDAGYRKKGIGKALVTRALSVLQEAGINKCHIFVFDDNLAAQQFWVRLGWTQRGDLKIMSCSTVSSQTGCC